MSEILIIGVDGSGITAHHQRLLKDCNLIVCSKRLESYLPEQQAEIMPITPLQEAYDKIAEALPSGKVAILASGDPLFFGIGNRIIEHFGDREIQIYPALSSLQEAFARFRMPWNDAAIVSLHGRKENHIPGLLLRQKKTFVLTDSDNSPDTLARILLEYLDAIGDEHIGKSTLMYVAENLGMENEKVSSGSLAEMSIKSFSNLNVVCIITPDLPEKPTFGLHEDEIAHSRGLITKDEVRAATLHRLRLPRQGVFWDIGGGSGSISVEAAAMFPSLNVYTVERKQEEIENIKKNIRRFALFNILPHLGDAADLLDLLPTPDAVFIGGSGGQMEKIIGTAAKRLTAGGRLVVNGVTEKTISLAPQLMQQNGLVVETSRIEVSRTGPGGPTSFNPITIMVGRK
jgi:precorrin-6B C5,15-methyltransferase / cobalt-precorrin-6B C5,C15-methyltransferase